MADAWTEWLLDVLRIPSIISEDRQLRAASLVMADLVRGRVDLRDREAEATFVPIIEALGVALQDGKLDDVLLRRKAVTLDLARAVRNQVTNLAELPVGRDSLAELVKLIQFW